MYCYKPDCLSLYPHATPAKTQTLAQGCGNVCDVAPALIQGLDTDPCLLGLDSLYAATNPQHGQMAQLGSRAKSSKIWRKNLRAIQLCIMIQVGLIQCARRRRASLICIFMRLGGIQLSGAIRRRLYHLKLNQILPPFLGDSLQVYSMNWKRSSPAAPLSSEGRRLLPMLSAVWDVISAVESRQKRGTDGEWIMKEMCRAWGWLLGELWGHRSGS